MPHVKPKDRIPLYSADNELQDWITPQRVARLEALGIVRVVRHKKGHVNRCIMQWRASDPRPTQISVYLGKPYSFLEHLDSGRVVWALRKLREGEGVPTALLQLMREAPAVHA
jgi:hypothetical protein